MLQSQAVHEVPDEFDQNFLSAMINGTAKSLHCPRTAYAPILRVQIKHGK